MNLLSSSILQVSQQKVTGFFPTFLFYSCDVLFTGYRDWLVLSVLFMNSFDFLFLSFPDSLEYIVYQHWKSLFVSPTIDIRAT